MKTPGKLWVCEVIDDKRLKKTLTIARFIWEGACFKRLTT